MTREIEVFTYWLMYVTTPDVRFVSIYSFAEGPSGLANVHGRGALLAHDGVYDISGCAGEWVPDGVADVVGSSDAVARVDMGTE